MKRILIVFAAAVIIAAAAHSPSAHAAGILIDDFTVAQGPFTTSSLISPDGGTLDTLSVLGGERDMGVGMEDLGGGSVTAEVTGGSLNYTQTGTITGGVGVSWDGDDNAWFPPDDAIDRDGLGGLDLTAGGIDAFCVTVEPSGPYDIAIGVTSDDASGSQFLVDLPAITETTVIKFPFADFSANDGEDPADFTNIGS
ncbi:MAG: hypothetical protein GYB64_17905, partial [Chloroflexi bacterium]|nr:hypothetical protein [Chloroflexota bacterium]